MAVQLHSAPGGPGIRSRWTSGAKTGVGTAASNHSNVWFTLGDGVLNEVFYPFADLACLRQLELIVTGANQFLSIEKWDAEHEADCLADGVPAYQLTNTCKYGRYRIKKAILADPNRSAVFSTDRIHPSPRQPKRISSLRPTQPPYRQPGESE